MPPQTTAPFTLKQFQLVRCETPDTTYALIVSNTSDRFFHLGHLVYIVPAFPYKLVQAPNVPVTLKRGVKVEGHRENYHQLKLPGGDDLWLATGLMRAITKGRIIGDGPISELREDLREEVQKQLRAQLAI